MLNYTRNLLKRSNTHSKTKSNSLEIAAGYRHLNRHSLGHCEEPFGGVYPEVSKGSGLRRELSRTTNSVTKQSQKDEIASLGSWVSQSRRNTDSSSTAVEEITATMHEMSANLKKHLFMP